MERKTQENKQNMNFISLVHSIDSANTFCQLIGFSDSEQVNKHTEKKDIIIVIDRSGSMAGAYINTTKEIVNKLLNCMDYNLVSTITMVSFNDKCEILTIIPEKSSDFLSQSLSFIDNIKSSGGTNFSNCFMEIMNILKSSLEMKNITKISDCSVIFFTDGQVEHSYDCKDNRTNLKNAINNLKSFLDTNITNCEFHTIGLSKDHDPLLLDNIITFGTKGSGTYQYIEKIEDFDLMFENLSQLINQKSDMQICISSKDKNVSLPLRLKQTNLESIELIDNSSGKFNSKFIWETDFFFSTTNFSVNELESFNLLLNQNQTKTSEEETYKFPKPSIIDLNKFPVQVLKIEFRYMSDEFSKINQELISKNNNLKDEELEKLNSKFNELKAKYYWKAKEIFRFNIEVRKNILGPTLDAIANFLRSIPEIINLCYKKSITNEIIAKVNALRYQHIINSRLKRQLETRTSNNVKLINESYKQIQDTCKSFDFKDLENRYSKLAEFMDSCALSCNNFIETLKENDCLCITFSVSRSELCIVKPSAIKINNLFPTMISGVSFLDSVKYTLSDSVEKSGGFDEEKPHGMFKGVANERINGCLPIYICDDHWKIAKYMIKPILGWTVTLDPLGYCNAQIRCIPFMLLIEIALKLCSKDEKNDMLYFKCSNSIYNEYKLRKKILLDIDKKEEKIEIENKDILFEQKLYCNLLETCEMIMNDDNEEFLNKKNWKEAMQEILSIDNYICKNKNQIEDDIKKTENTKEIVIIRGDDIISNNDIFLTHLYCAIRLKWIEAPPKEKFNDFFDALIEEELRRKQITFKTEDLNKIFFKLLNIDNQRIKDYGNLKLEYLNQENERLDKVLKLKENANLNVEVLEKLKENFKDLPSEHLFYNIFNFEGEKIKSIYQEKLEFASTVNINEIIVNGTLDQDQYNAEMEYLYCLKEHCQKLFILRNFFFSDLYSEETHKKEQNKIEEDQIKINSIVELPTNHKFSHINIKNYVEFLCLYIQNKDQVKTADRISALKYNFYLNPRIQSEAEQYLIKISKRIILDLSDEEFKWKRIENDLKVKSELLKDKIFSGNREKLLDDLTNETCVDRMASIIRNINMRSRYKYFKYLLRNGAVEMLEILKLLIVGKHNEDYFQPEWKYKTSGKKVRKCIKLIRRTHQRNDDKEDWNNLFEDIL